MVEQRTENPRVLGSIPSLGILILLCANGSVVEHRLAKARAASSNLVSRFASVKITEVLFSDGFPSGQRGRTVNPLSQTSKVRILPHPLIRVSS